MGILKFEETKKENKNNIVNIFITEEDVINKVSWGNYEQYEVKLPFFSKTILVPVKFVRETKSGKISIGLLSNTWYAYAEDTNFAVNGFALIQEYFKTIQDREQETK